MVGSDDLRINDDIVVPAAELDVSALRSQGPGGQHVNKVATAVQLKFDAVNSRALPQRLKHRLAELTDRRIGRDGVITIKAQRTRSRERNLDDARQRLRILLLEACVESKKRVATRPGSAVKAKRLDDKGHRGRVKRLRGRIRDSEP